MMKLSEAIRLGSMLHPQAIGGYADRNSSGQVIRTCALGAAGMAVCGSPTKSEEFWAFKDVAVDCPATITVSGNVVARCVRHYTVTTMIVHLNDDHQWTRESIATWLETNIEPHNDLERKVDQTKADAVECGSIAK